VRKKVKKVIKGLKKASKTHAKQAGVLKKAFKVLKLRGGGMDASKADFGDSGALTSDAGFENTSKSKVSSGGGGNGGSPKTKKPKPSGGGNTDVPFKAPLPYVGPVSALINLGAYGNYKGRQRFSKKEGLYRDYYKTQKKVLQPNSPEGKKYLKDAGFGKPPPVVADNNGGPPPILPIKPQAASVNEPLNTVESPYKKPTVVDGVFNYSVGLKKGGMLIKGKPKLTKKGWK
tara:strand:- start:35 stop:727 length:693 start_codon:yes stop_codon:yes gene_type:complete